MHVFYQLSFAEIRCSEAPEITNTALVNSSLHAAPSHAIGTTLTYVCDDGYRFIDGSTVDSLVCDVTGQWNGIDSYGDGRNINPDIFVGTILTSHGLLLLLSNKSEHVVVAL